MSLSIKIQYLIHETSLFASRDNKNELKINDNSMYLYGISQDRKLMHS